MYLTRCAAFSAKTHFWWGRGGYSVLIWIKKKNPALPHGQEKPVYPKRWDHPPELSLYNWSYTHGNLTWTYIVTFNSEICRMCLIYLYSNEWSTVVFLSRSGFKYSRVRLQKNIRIEKVLSDQLLYVVLHLSMYFFSFLLPS